MADNEPNDQESKANEDQENPQGAIASTDEPNGEGDPDAGELGDEENSQEDDAAAELERARAELKETRAEAAARRVELRELREGLKGKTPEEIEAALTDHEERLATKDRELFRERAARKFDLPDEILGRLSGNTEEEIFEDAESLSKLFKTKQSRNPAPLTPSGGRNPSGTPDSYDPEAEYKKAKRLR